MSQESVSDNKFLTKEQLEDISNNYYISVSELIDVYPEAQISDDVSVQNNLASISTKLTSYMNAVGVYGGYNGSTSANGVDKNINVLLTNLNDYLLQLESKYSSPLNSILPKIFQTKITTQDMIHENASLYTNQLIKNWEILVGIIFLIFYIIWYYRKYFDTKELIIRTADTYQNIKKDIVTSIESSKQKIMNNNVKPKNEEILKK